MGKRLKKRLKIESMLLAIIMTVILVVTPSVAWLAYTLTYSIRMQASLNKSYFESGDGATATQYHIGYDVQGNPVVNPECDDDEDCAYEIHSPIQLFYFSWLQNMGYFNDKEYYFYLSADLDMSGYVLPPAGTIEYPFIGQFNGKGFTISNLSIKSSSVTSDLTDVPYKEVDVRADTNSQVLGLFGVIGDYRGAGTYSAYSPSVCDFTIKDATIDSVSPLNSKTLSGIVAGYINGVVEDVVVDQTDSGGNVVKISSGLNALDGFSSFSDYGVAGYCESAYRDTIHTSEVDISLPVKVTNYAGGTGAGEGTGAGDNWGGSLDMYGLYNRLLTVYDNYAVISGEHDKRTVNYLDSGDNVVSSEQILLSGSGTYRSYYSSDFAYTFNRNSDVNNKNYMYIYGDVDSETSRGVQTMDTVSRKQTSVSGQKFKISYTENSTTSFYIYYTSGGTTHYLTLNGTSLVDTTTKSSAVIWEKYAYSGYTCIRSSGNSVRYLNVSTKGTLGSFPAATTDTTRTWTFNDASSTFATRDGCFIQYNSGWKGAKSNASTTYRAKTEYYSGTSYLSYNSRYQLSATGSSSDAKEWLFSNGKLFTVIGDSVYYVCGDGSSLSLSMTTPFNDVTSWVLVSGTSFSYTYGGNTYYLTIPMSGPLPSTTAQTVSITNTSTISPAIDVWHTVGYSGGVSSPTGEDGFPCAYMPLNVNSANILSTLPNNTGYIIGGKQSANSTTVNQGDIRVSKYAMSNLSSTSTVYTINGSGRNTDMSDFVKYEDAREGVDAMFAADSDWIYGLHFMNATVSTSNTVTIPRATINGNVYSNYTVPQSCIDFNLKEKGYINFFAGTYFAVGQASENDVFFSLHKIDRDSNKNITNITEINTIYKKTDGSYEYNTQSTGSSLVFNTSWLTNPGSANWTNNALYYFEIPVNAGEYALGSTAGNGAYLIYLDISASGGEGVQEAINGYKIVEYAETTVLNYSYPKGIELASLSNTIINGPISSANTETSVSAIRTPAAASRTVWQWQKETFVGTVGQATYTPASPLIIAKITKTEYDSGGNIVSANSYTRTYDKKGSAAWASVVTPSIQFLNITDSSISGYFASSSKYTYSGVPLYNAGETATTAASIFSASNLLENAFFDDNAAIGDLHLMNAGKTYAVTLQTEGNLHNILDTGCTSSTSGSTVTITKSAV